MYASNLSGKWSIEALDCQAPWGSSLALDASGNWCIGYCDSDYNLQFTFSYKGRHTTDTVDSGITFLSVSLALSSGHPAISYLDDKGNLRYAAYEEAFLP